MHVLAIVLFRMSYQRRILWREFCLSYLAFIVLKFNSRVNGTSVVITLDINPEIDRLGDEFQRRNDHEVWYSYKRLYDQQYRLDFDV